MKVVATTRKAQGTGASRRLRHQNKVPGILYGGKSDAVNIELDHNPLFHSLRREKFHASVLDMELDGRAEKVLLRDFQMHPYRAQVLHIDFQRVAEDQKIHVRVPLHFVGAESAPAVKLSGAIIGHVRSELDISCLPRDLPEFIEVDLSHLTAQDTVHALDLKLPKGVSAVLRGKENPVVVSVTLPIVQAEEAAPVEEAAGAAPGAPAAGAPAAGAAAAPAKGGAPAPAAGKAPAGAAPAPAAKPAGEKKK
ncbi:MAG TPA: 50S ribosomal protein L25/general stress protein Ctc [Burkholderiaceae bacterium]